jgi:hypothetical protein
MEEENDYDAFFNSCNAPQESASWTDELQAIVESEGQNSRENFFQLCMKRKLADQDHSYKYSSSASSTVPSQVLNNILMYMSYDKMDIRVQQPIYDSLFCQMKLFDLVT